jgi:hypothetical protein
MNRSTETDRWFATVTVPSALSTHKKWGGAHQQQKKKNLWSVFVRWTLTVSPEPFQVILSP